MRCLRDGNVNLAGCWVVLGRPTEGSLDQINCEAAAQRRREVEDFSRLRPSLTQREPLNSLA